MAVNAIPSKLPVEPVRSTRQDEELEVNPKGKHKMAEDALLRIHLDNLNHPATEAFISVIDMSTVIRKAIDQVHKHLFKPYGKPQAVRSVTLILRGMGGVAYTSGLPIDEQHKEIVFSLDYIANLIGQPLRLRHEATGVITHEMVHCFQHNCKGTAPGGLIEGIADWVRLKSGLAPPHWNKGSDETTRGKSWDEGYQKTAWFLEFIESKFGPGSISRLNAAMRDTTYEEKEFWPKLFNGKTVKELWERYKATWADETEDQNTESQEDQAANDINRDTVDWARKMEDTVSRLTQAMGQVQVGIDNGETNLPSSQQSHKSSQAQTPISDAGSEAEMVEMDDAEEAKASN